MVATSCAGDDVAEHDAVAHVTAEVEAAVLVQAPDGAVGPGVEKLARAGRAGGEQGVDRLAHGAAAGTLDLLGVLLQDRLQVLGRSRQGQRQQESECAEEHACGVP